MQDQLDPIDSALESLRGRQWPGDYSNNQQKDKLMQEFQTKRSSNRLGRYGALAVTLAVLVLGSAGFAAAGGVEMVKTWFVTITVEVDGEVVDDFEIDPSDITIYTEDDMATVTIDGLEVNTDGEGDAAQAEVVTIRLQAEAAAGEDGTLVFENDGAFVHVTRDGAEVDAEEDAGEEAHAVTITINAETPDAEEEDAEPSEDDE